MYQRIDEAELKAFGFTKADFDAEIVEIWPDTLDAYRLFDGMNTQWLVGMSSVHGLIYASLPIVAMALGLELNSEVMSDIRVMEVAALKEMNKDK
jgi:hypothetical protein